MGVDASVSNGAQGYWDDFESCAAESAEIGTEPTA
jgi:hypothetical protein